MKKNSYFRICIASLAALLADSPVFACKCTGESSPADAFTQAHEVFAGTVIEIAAVLIDETTGEVLPDNSGGSALELAVEQSESLIFTHFSMNQVTFQVIESWKGSNTITKLVLTGKGGGDCGFEFVRGSNYLVYAYGSHRSEYAGTVNICSRTAWYSTAVADRQFLGTGQKPIHPVLYILADQSTTILTWQTNWTNFRLEASRGFKLPVLWESVSNFVGIVGRNYVVTNDTASPGALFRLAR